jgi:hypothetical protein
MANTHNTDRDPCDEAALAAAAAAFHVEHTGEADVAFEAALLEQGVLNPSEIVALLEKREDGSVLVLLADEHGTEIVVHACGRVDYC